MRLPLEKEKKISDYIHPAINQSIKKIDKSINQSLLIRKFTFLDTLRPDWPFAGGSVLRVSVRRQKRHINTSRIQLRVANGRRRRGGNETICSGQWRRRLFLHRLVQFLRTFGRFREFGTSSGLFVAPFELGIAHDALFAVEGVGAFMRLRWTNQPDIVLDELGWSRSGYEIIACSTVRSDPARQKCKTWTKGQALGWFLSIMLKIDHFTLFLLRKEALLLFI